MKRVFAILAFLCVLGAGQYVVVSKFAIRHENPQQQREYGTEWLVWIFHVFYATVRVGLELLDRADWAALW